MSVKIDWDVLADIKLNVNGVPTWTRVVDFIPPKTTIRVVAGGMWTFAGNACSVEGNIALPTTLRIIGDYPAGALLGKIGGSTAGQKEGSMFAIGHGVAASGDNGGPLFVAINAEPILFTLAAPIHIKVWMMQ